MKQAIIVQNLRCGGCANTITKKLTAISGVQNLNINIEASEISFESENESVTNSVITQLAALGYPQATDDNSLALKAKSFVSCATGKFSS